MAKFAKLGKKAKSFSDPYSKLTLFGKMVVKLEPKQQVSPKVLRAFQGGHLVSATKEEFNAWEEIAATYKKDAVIKKTDTEKKLRERIEELESKNTELEEALLDPDEKKEKTLEEKLTILSKDGLLEYYKDTYELSPEEIKEFEGLKHPDRVIFLVKLDEEEKKEEE